MRRRWLFALALVAAFATPRELHAQGGSIGTRISVTPSTRPGGPRRAPAPRQPVPPIRRPVGTITTVSAIPGRYAHRMYVLRSPVLGVFAFDPYWWLAPDVVDETIVAPPPMPPGPPLTGGLQLDVEPRRALVYLDGIFVGIVDQFKGYFQHLETAAGYHVVEFIAADYDPLVADVTVTPNTTTTYRASLNRAGGR
ncbi:MAG TPA: hypothetical protein VKE51_38670 [Vicinamibacterales bacterium]|nr:hypothetical protein [Vicinamibacterales bacterium]